MGFYDEPDNIAEYIKMAEGYDGRELIGILERHLPAGSTVLELGMGPGTDLDLLGRIYAATGSDISSVFINLYREIHPDADLEILNAADFSINRSFDCIYSNKVLYHLSKADLRHSFTLQREHLNEAGLLMHSFWRGDSEETEQGLRFVYYTIDSLTEMIGPGFTVVETNRYAEMEDDDSLYVVLRKTSDK